MPGGNTQPAQGGITGFLAKAPDPLGISNGGGGLDPFNLMGSPAPGPTAPDTLPTLPGMHPKFYDPNSFVPRTHAPGMWNGIVAQMAGPMYDPRVMNPAMKKSTDPSKGSRGAFDIGGPSQGFGGGGASIISLLQNLSNMNRPTMPVTGRTY